MSVTANDIIKFVETIAPESTQESWDNSGIQIGKKDSEIKKVLLSLDITDNVVDFSIKNECDMIFSHHPFLFDGIKKIDFDAYRGNIIKELIKSDIFVYSAHTNFDISDSGINFLLAREIGLSKIENLKNEDIEEIGVVGDFYKSFDEMIEILSKNICPHDYIRVFGRKIEKIDRLALVGGAGVFALDFLEENDSDVLITSDVKYHDGQKAYEKGKMLVDIGHYYSEIVGLKKLREIFSDKFCDVKFYIYDKSDFIVK